MKRLHHVFVLVLLGLGIGCNNLHSATLTWNGSVSSDWNNPTNWIPQQVPTNTDHVVINSGSVTIPSDGVFAIMDWTGGNVSGSLTVASNGLLNVTGSADKLLLGPLTNSGSVIWTGSGELRLYYWPGSSYFGSIYNLAGGLFDIQTDEVLNNYSGSEVFSNAGTLRKSAGPGTTTCYPQLINTGLVDVESGTLALDGGGIIDGQFYAAAGATALFNGPFTSGLSPALTGPGAFQFTAGALTLSYNVIPHLQLLGGALLPGPAFQGGSITNLTLPGMTLNGTNSVTGTATLGGGDSGALTVASNGVVNWTGGNVSGSLTVASNGLLNVTGNADKLLLGPLTNSGSVIWTGSGQLRLYYSPGSSYFGSIYNLAGGLFDIQTDEVLNNYSGSEVFSNAGTLRKSAGPGATTCYPQLNNTGLVDVESGTLALDGGGIIDGQFYAAAGATALFNGPFTSGLSPALTGPGTFQFTAGALTLSYNVIPHLQLLGGALLLGPAFQGGSITNLTLPGMTLNGTNSVIGTATLGGGDSGALTVASNGVVNWTGGNVSGSLTVASNGVLNVTGNAEKDLLAPLTNSGSVVWTGSGLLRLFYLPGNGDFGSIYNLAGGLFDIQTDEPLYDFFGNEFFNNAGTLRKSAGPGTTSFAPQLINTGLVEADSGTLSFQTSPNLTGGELSFGLSSLSNFGKINISGNAALNSTVGVAWLGGYVPSTNDSFTVLGFGSFTGLFTSLDFPSAALWVTNYTATTFTVTVASVGKLMFTAQPVGGELTNVILAPVVVQVETTTGVPVKAKGVPVTISLASGSGVMQGTLTQNSDANGEATFSDLKFTQTGFKTLRASSISQTAATSLPFKIVAVEEEQWTTNGFLLSLYGTNSLGPTIIYASTNLTDWAPIYTNPPTTNSIQFFDASSTNIPVRFYQAVEQ